MNPPPFSPSSVEAREKETSDRLQILCVIEKLRNAFLLESRQNMSLSFWGLGPHPDTAVALRGDGHPIHRVASAQSPSLCSRFYVTSGALVFLLERCCHGAFQQSQVNRTNSLQKFTGAISTASLLPHPLPQEFFNIPSAFLLISCLFF